MTITVGVDTFVAADAAETYFESRLRSEAWGTTSTETKAKALRLATAILTRQRYVGTIVSDGQLLAWPRSGACDAEGRAIASTAIPQSIADATCEFALRLLTDDFYADVQSKGVKKMTVANIVIEYDGRAPEREMPDIVLEIIRPFLRSEPNEVSVQLVI